MKKAGIVSVFCPILNTRAIMTAKNFTKKPPMGITFHGKNITATLCYDDVDKFKKDIKKLVKPYADDKT